MIISIPVVMDRFAKRAKKAGYEVETFDADRRIYKISKGDRFFFTVGMHFPFNSHVSFEIAKRKDLTKQILHSFGLSVPGGILTNKWSEVLDTLKNGDLTFPLVIKPDTALTGILVTAKIEDEQSLRKAFNAVHAEFGKVVVEEYFEGEDFRFLVLDGKVLAIAKRVYPKVIGDGRKKVSELIKEYAAQPVITFVMSEEVERSLKGQGYTLNSILPKGKTAVLRRNANVFTGGIVENFTDEAAEKFKKIAVEAAKIIGLRFSGVDILIKDIRDENSEYSIVEVNCDPGYDIHEIPRVGKPFRAEEAILRSLLG